jgi:hypothetical protein
MKKHTIKLAVITSYLSCSGCYTSNDNPVGLNYQPVVLVSNGKKKIPASSVTVVQINGVIPEDRDARLIGESIFISGTADFSLVARKKAAKIGATRVIIGSVKSGKAQGDRMVLAAATASSVGFSTSNAFATAASKYGTTTYSGTGFSTTYNPGQKHYVRQEYIYETYKYTLKFYE